jgi:hypothetical protein
MTTPPTTTCSRRGFCCPTASRMNWMQLSMSSRLTLSMERDHFAAGDRL